MEKHESDFNNIHWTTTEEMLFTAESKYNLRLPQDFPLMLKFYQFSVAHPVIPNYHDFYEIGYYYSGKGKCYIADKSYSIKAGNIVFIQAGQMHYVEAVPDDPLKSASIYFMPELVYHPGSNPYEANYLLPFSSTESKEFPVLQEQDLEISVSNILYMMQKELTDQTEFYQLSLKNQLCQILVAVLKTMKVYDTPTGAQIPMNRIKRLTTVFERIHQDFAEEIPLNHLAELASMSQSYFCRYFKQVTGLTPVNYILRFRIEKAKEMLVNTDFSITEIAFQTGFNSSSYFDRIFQRFTKQTPQQFRQSCSA